jgi:hypothetical protein
MPEPAYQPMTVEEIIKILNHHKYYSLDCWEWDNMRGEFGYKYVTNGEDNWWGVSVQEAEEVAKKLRAGVCLPSMSRQEVVDSLNRFGIHGHSAWTWNREDNLFEVPGRNYPLIQLSPDVAVDIAFKHKCGYLVDETKLAAIKPAQPLKKKPRIDRIIELVIEADNLLVGLAAPTSGTIDTHRAQLGVISRMMTLLKHDLRSVERQMREGQ